MLILNTLETKDLINQADYEDVVDNIKHTLHTKPQLALLRHKTKYP